MQKPRPSLFTPLLLLVMATLLIPAASDAQSNRGSLTGVITDSSGAVVSDAEMVLRSEASGREIQRTSANDGGYAFLQLVPGRYELQVVVGGFEPYIRPGIEVPMARHVRIDVSLALGGQTEVVEVTASSLTFNTGSRAGSIQPEAVDTLPLLLDGAVRTSAGFAVLMPGISTSMPALVRAPMRELSNWARLAMMVKISSPCGVVVSMFSWNEMKSTPKLWNSLSAKTRACVDRAKRS